MRKIILNLCVSLDGYIEGSNGEYDWCLTDNDYGMTDFLNNTDAIFFGRKSYELLISTDAHAFADKTRHVFSNTLQSIENDVLINGNVEESIRRIKRQKGKNIWLFGGAELTNYLLNLQLVDEMHLAVHPILLGSGKPLFKHFNHRIHFKLVTTKTYDSGLVQLIYSK